MAALMRLAVAALALLLAGCSSADPTGGAGSEGAPDSGTEQDGAPSDASSSTTDAHDGAAPATDGAGDDGGDDAGCAVFGAPGECITTTACAALGDHSSYPGYCPGPATVECCIDTPDTADNPPVPSGYELMQQSQVTPAMTAWAVMILDDPKTYPMFDTVMQTFGAQPVLARVEWHPPDFQNSVVHRGVTLYVPG
jgi:hypothetical protein